MNPEFLKMLSVDQATADWFYETDPVTGTTFGMKTLLSDPQTGMSVLYCVYPKGYCKPAHHHTFGQGLYVLEGVMQADGKLFHPGEFVWYPAGVVGSHGATEAGDVAFLAFANGEGKLFYD